jgi:hypothetical protein
MLMSAERNMDVSDGAMMAVEPECRLVMVMRKDVVVVIYVVEAWNSAKAAAGCPLSQLYRGKMPGDPQKALCHSILRSTRGLTHGSEAIFPERSKT